MGDKQKIASFVKSGEKEDIIQHSVPLSPLWAHFTKRFLTKNLRLQSNVFIEGKSNTESYRLLQEQDNYAKIILAIGDGRHMSSTFQEGYDSRASRMQSYSQ